MNLVEPGGIQCGEQAAKGSGVPDLDRGTAVFGHNWEPAEGTIVDSRITRYIPIGPGLNEMPVHKFIVDVRPVDGQAFRTTIEEPTGKIVPPDVGDVVRVEVDSKNKNVRFDEDDPKLNVRAQAAALKQSADDRFNTPLGEGPDKA